MKGMKKGGKDVQSKPPAKDAPRPMKANKGGPRAKAIMDRYGNLPIR